MSAELSCPLLPSDNGLFEGGRASGDKGEAPVGFGIRNYHKKTNKPLRDQWHGMETVTGNSSIKD